ncbi:MAG: hypothetical protein E7Z69_06760 [Thermoplasmata archaeon]|nr:hypothetical protein [Thermoplasmata archaeon]
METDDIMSWVDGNVPQLILLLGGLLALVIASYYVKDKESGAYKGFMVLGVIFGVLMAIVAATRYNQWGNFTILLVVLAAFTLVIRPFRDVHFAVIIAVMIMVLIYVYLGGLNGAEIAGVDLTPLSQGWPRVIVAFIAGSFVYMLLHFAEALVGGIGKLMNMWPVLAAFGVICIAEATAMFLGYGSILDLLGIKFRNHRRGGQADVWLPVFPRFCANKPLNDSSRWWSQCGLVA